MRSLLLSVPFARLQTLTAHTRRVLVWVRGYQAQPDGSVTAVETSFKLQDCSPVYAATSPFCHGSPALTSQNKITASEETHTAEEND
jgi:hypothetical protein